MGSPAIMGKTARMMGTAPRSPTQEMNQRSRGAKFLNGSSPIQTDTGRANRIIHMARASAGRAMGSSLWGGGEQPQHQEHADLAEPGQAVQHGEGGAAAAQGEVAKQQAGEVDGEDAAAPTAVVRAKMSRPPLTVSRG